MEPSQVTKINETILSIREELQEVRQLTLEASRKGDWRTVASLTSKASGLNTQIFNLETRLMTE